MPKKNQVDKLQACDFCGRSRKEPDIIVEGMMEDLLRIAAIPVPVAAKAPQDSQYTAGPQPVKWPVLRFY